MPSMRERSWQQPVVHKHICVAWQVKWDPFEFGGIKPIGSMYDIFTYIYHKNQLNVGIYMDPVGKKQQICMVICREFPWPQAVINGTIAPEKVSISRVK